MPFVCSKAVAEKPRPISGPDEGSDRAVSDRLFDKPDASTGKVDNAVG